jgi:tetratricopeptide (TPR) repeat protein
VLITLPVFFAERRYRQPRQVVLLAVIYATTLAYGAWVMATGSPFAAKYTEAGDWLFGALPQADWFTRFWTHLWWLLRDLGTHEFFPWLLLLPLLAPWLPRAWLPAKVHRLRPLSLRGGLLVLIVILYLVVAAALTPADMARGPMAEMRYVVPLLALGATVGGIALVILWNVARWTAVVGLLLLVCTNWLHLGFLAHRVDGTRAWWPPTLVRYVAEQMHDFTTGNEAMIGLLREVPSGTTVRSWPQYMVYPPMYYVPRLHYCDQLTEAKPIRAELKARLPDYVYTERARPELVLVPAPYVGEALRVLSIRFGPGSYRLAKTLPGQWNYMSKPEIPIHFFQAPANGHLFPGMAVLVASGSPLTEHRSIRSNGDADAESLHRMALSLISAGELSAAESRLQESLRLEPHQHQARLQLGALALQRGAIATACEHFRAVLDADPECAEAHLSLGAVLERQGRRYEAREHYLEAIRLREDWPLAYFNLGNLTAADGAISRAIDHYRKAIELDPRFAEARINLGLALLKTGERAEAAKQFRAVLVLLPPDSPKAAQVRAILGGGKP